MSDVWVDKKVEKAYPPRARGCLGRGLLDHDLDPGGLLATHLVARRGLSIGRLLGSRLLGLAGRSGRFGLEREVETRTDLEERFELTFGFFCCCCCGSSVLETPSSSLDQSSSLSTAGLDLAFCWALVRSLEPRFF